MLYTIILRSRGLLVPQRTDKDETCYVLQSSLLQPLTLFHDIQSSRRSSPRVRGRRACGRRIVRVRVRLGGSPRRLRPPLRRVDLAAALRRPGRLARVHGRTVRVVHGGRHVAHVVGVGLIVAAAAALLRPAGLVLRRLIRPSTDQALVDEIWVSTVRPCASAALQRNKDAREDRWCCCS